MKYKYLTLQYNDTKDLKSHYYKLAKQHHPDLVGGDKTVMQVINSELDSLLKDLNNNRAKKAINRTNDRNNRSSILIKEVVRLYPKILGYRVEIATFKSDNLFVLKVYGAYDIKEDLKRFGFRYDGFHKSWHKTVSLKNWKTELFKERQKNNKDIFEGE